MVLRMPIAGWPKEWRGSEWKERRGGIMNWVRLAGSLALGTGLVLTLCLAAALGLLETRLLSQWGWGHGDGVKSALGSSL